MLYNYLKVILRNFMNDRLYTIIIVLGLAVGLSCCLMIAQYIHFELSFDKHVKDRDQIYYVYMRWQSSEGEFDNFCHPPIGPLMKNSIPGVSTFIRIAPAKLTATTDNDEMVLRREVDGRVAYNELEKGIYFADPEILTFFSIPLVAGNQVNALHDPLTVVITESVAAKVFPGESPLGKIIGLQRGKQIEEYRITAIAKEPEANSSLQFRCLVSSVGFFNRWDDAWVFPGFQTFVKLRGGTDPAEIETKINHVATERLAALEEEYAIKEQIRLYPFREFHFYRPYNNWGISAIKFTGDKRLIKFFAILGVLILIVSWANYINLTTARALRRAKEVSLRKVNGASRGNVIEQFLIEFLFLNVTSVILAFTLAQLLFNHFAAIIGSKAEWTFWTEPIFWIAILAFTALSTLVSGFYPAFIMSDYSPSKVLKGSFDKSQTGKALRKGLVLTQLGVSIFMLMSIYVISRQLVHMQNKDLGMIADQVLVLNTTKLDTALSRSTAFQQWKGKVESLPYVKATCGAGFYPGEKLWWIYFYDSDDHEKKQQAFRFTVVTSNYPNTMSIDFLAGRDFSDQSFDNSKAIISETAARDLGYREFDQALGKSITLNHVTDTRYEIIGVVKDFRVSAKDVQIGEVIVQEQDFGCRYFLVKLSAENLSETLIELEKQWKNLFPNSPFDYFFLDTVFDSFYRDEQQFTAVFVFFCMIGIVITCMGLFGLSLYNTTSCTKEIGIRKSLGGTATNIIWLFSKDYMKLVFTAGVLALPVSYWLLDKWLENYPNRITLQVDAIAIPLMLMTIIAMGTVGYQTFKAARVNPVESLKTE